MSRRLAVLALGRPGACPSLNRLTLAKFATPDVMTPEVMTVDPGQIVARMTPRWTSAP